MGPEYQRSAILVFLLAWTFDRNARLPVYAGSQGTVEKCSKTGQSARSLGSAQLAFNRYSVSVEFSARDLGRPGIWNSNRSTGPNRDLRVSGLNDRTFYETRMLAVNTVP